jgi:hypothetical protein
MTNTTNAQTRLEQLQARIREFEKAQKRYQAYGAADTEPDAVFQSLLRRAVFRQAGLGPPRRRGLGAVRDEHGLFPGGRCAEPGGAGLRRPDRVLPGQRPAGDRGLPEQILLAVVPPADQTSAAEPRVLRRRRTRRAGACPADRGGEPTLIRQGSRSVGNGGCRSRTNFPTVPSRRQVSADAAVRSPFILWQSASAVCSKPRALVAVERQTVPSCCHEAHDA